MNPTQKQFSLNRVASRKQIPISKSKQPGHPDSGPRRKTMTVLAAVTTLFIAVATLSAYQTKPINLTGVWTGTLYRVEDNPKSAYLDLKQKDADLTGTAGPDANRQDAIAHGKLSTVKDVTSVTFDVAQSNGGVMKFDLKLVDGRLKGKVTVEANGKVLGEATLDLGREMNRGASRKQIPISSVIAEVLAGRWKDRS
ncbi:MAG: hypothetical protein EXS29_00575 [Pedosphaera sp.]|nr:hypothetical protein [Pedosphaera sp.]